MFGCRRQFLRVATRGASKQPVRFMLKSEEPFAFAGIEVEAHKAFVIVTTEPNDLVRPGAHTNAGDPESCGLS